MKDSENYLRFKDECSRFYFYMAEMGKIADSIGLAFHKMEGLYGVKMTKIGSSPSPHESHYLEHMEVKTELQKQFEQYQKKVSDILCVIDHIPDQAIQPAVFQIFINGESFSREAAAYDIDRNRFTDVIRKEIEESLNHTELYRNH